MTNARPGSRHGNRAFRLRDRSIDERKRMRPVRRSIGPEETESLVECGRWRTFRAESDAIEGGASELEERPDHRAADPSAAKLGQHIAPAHPARARVSGIRIAIEP